MFLEREKATLSEYAFLTVNTRGRDYPCEPCDNRTEFQRDRDKIIHSESFRCLMNKTQVFLAPTDAHYRTRLTHTLEVTQIARIIARALRLNEDLCEAIGLGHDLGHTPFGHAGEAAMQTCYSSNFTHYGQSLRVVERLENQGRGLNLTYEVRDGIVNHTGSHMASTLEGVIVKFADRIAYINHDIDDACRAGILSIGDIPREIREVVGDGHSQRINTMVTSIIDYSTGKNEIGMTPEIGEATDKLRTFMFENVYSNPIAKGEETRAKEVLVRLFEYYVRYPEKMPRLFYENTKNESVGRCVCDFISAMTDRYAIEQYKELFIPKVWRGKE
ncbi:MAG: deoxyguanosinetriphosphate triphosphohydrolase [Clostridia bacterium]|nr:deoxyguanosinetriphosphate triphosphohydrolase [Clostridia bacterium]